MNDKSKHIVNEEYVSGTVERITYHNSYNGFCVLRIKLSRKKDLVTLTGNVSSIFAGEYLQSHGEEED